MSILVYLYLQKNNDKCHIKFTYKTMIEMFIKKQWQVIQKIMASYSKNNGKLFKKQWQVSIIP